MLQPIWHLGPTGWSVWRRGELDDSPGIPCTPYMVGCMEYLVGRPAPWVNCGIMPPGHSHSYSPCTHYLAPSHSHSRSHSPGTATATAQALTTWHPATAHHHHHPLPRIASHPGAEPPSPSCVMHSTQVLSPPGPPGPRHSASCCLRQLASPPPALPRNLSRSWTTRTGLSAS